MTRAAVRQCRHPCAAPPESLLSAPVPAASALSSGGTVSCGRTFSPKRTLRTHPTRHLPVLSPPRQMLPPRLASCTPPHKVSAAVPSAALTLRAACASTTPAVYCRVRPSLAARLEPRALRVACPRLAATAVPFCPPHVLVLCRGATMLLL